MDLILFALLAFCASAVSTAVAYAAAVGADLFLEYWADRRATQQPTTTASSFETHTAQSSQPDTFGETRHAAEQKRRDEETKEQLVQTQTLLVQAVARRDELEARVAALEEIVKELKSNTQ